MSLEKFLRSKNLDEDIVRSEVYLWHFVLEVIGLILFY